jgi:hypothetical protein
MECDFSKAQALAEDALGAFVNSLTNVRITETLMVVEKKADVASKKFKKAVNSAKSSGCLPDLSKVQSVAEDALGAFVNSLTNVRITETLMVVEKKADQTSKKAKKAAKDAKAFIRNFDIKKIQEAM